MPMLIAMLVAQVVQAICAYFVQGEGAFGVTAALLGVKPMVDGYQILFEAERQEGHFDPVYNFAATRAVAWLQEERARRLVLGLDAVAWLTIIKP